MSTNEESMSMNMNVNQLIEFLVDLQARGHGENSVVLPVHTLSPTIGGRKSVGVHGGELGFDWDMGKVFLNTSEPLSLHETKMQQAYRKMEHRAGMLHVGLSRILKNPALSADDKINQLNQMLENMLVVKPSSAPKMG